MITCQACVHEWSRAEQPALLKSTPEGGRGTVPGRAGPLGCRAAGGASGPANSDTV